MKKITWIIGIVVLGLAMMSFQEPSKEIVKQSKVHWIGFKVGSSHKGDINLKSGFLMMDKGKVIGGEFVVDMTTIQATDLSGKGKQRLERHLKENDFFSVKKHKESKLVFKSVKFVGKNKYAIVANLTIKGISKEIKFNLIQDDNKKFSVKLKINRADYHMKYKSSSFFKNLGDKLIYDDFHLDIEFTI